MVTLLFSHQSLVGGSTIGMGIKKAQAPTHIVQGLPQPYISMRSLRLCAHSIEI